MAINYDLNNTGPEVQERLDQVMPNKADIEQEALDRQAGDNALQEQITAINNEIGESGQGGETINGRLDTLEAAVGDGGSVDERIAASAAELVGTATEDYDTLGKVEGVIEQNKSDQQAVNDDTYRKNETYSKEQVDIIAATTPQANVNVMATSETTSPTDVLPAQGDAHTLYRVGNWNGSEYDPDAYTEYTWDGSQYVQLAVRSGSLDQDFFNVSEYTGDTYAGISNAANAVPLIYRKPGLVITYKDTTTGNWFSLQYIAADITNWSTASNWNLPLAAQTDGEPTPGSDNLVKSGGVVKRTLEEYNSDIPVDDNILDVFIDKNNIVFALLLKNGSIEFLVKNQHDTMVDENIRLLSVDIDNLKNNFNKVSFIDEVSPYQDENVVTYFADADNKVFAVLYKDGRIEKLMHSEKEHEEEQLLKLVSSESPYQKQDILKFLIDERNVVFGDIRKDGTIHISKLLADEFKAKNDLSALYAPILTILANGLSNIDLSKKTKTMQTIFNLKTPSPLIINGDNENNINLRPCISIIDDDTIDYQIPSSVGAQSPSSNRGGYFSVMLPFLLSLGSKYNISVKAAIACEGHRVGLTTLRQPNDDYTALNTNGLVVKFAHNVLGWNVFNHSMTAQLPQRTYYVDGINSQLADTILANGYYAGQCNFNNTIVIDRSTGKWYEVNSTKTAWVERIPQKKYCMPFYRDYNTGKWYFNRDFDFEYNWGEWCKRADELGLPYERVIVHNGSTSSVYMINGSRKYADYSVRTAGVWNKPPIAASVCRVSNISGSSEGSNAKDAVYEQTLKDDVDICITDKSWMVFMTHFGSKSHLNSYLDDYTYPEHDANYNQEWILPLKENEILDIIGDNVHDYINHPPSRLGISTWNEWLPASGTQLRAFYDVIDYALSKGVDIVLPTEGWLTHGNILNIGVDRNGQTFSYDSASEQTPYTDEELSFLTIGANSEIRLFNNKN